MGCGPSEVESVVISSAFWLGRRVFLTGHTGFKGSWLALMLSQLNAQVTGYALDPPTQPSLFDLAQLHTHLHDVRGDVRDAGGLAAAMREADPEIVIHMAAQPLVKAGYTDPAGTFATNVMGTVNALEAARGCRDLRAVVVVTTDKCYENHGGAAAFLESDALGGYDPYSNSKACSELVASCYRDSFFRQAGVALATARAGNVIGGGDFAADRIVPDAVRAFMAGRSLQVRRPDAVRPWQHVLEPLYGYLLLAEQVFNAGDGFAEGWNFGPGPGNERNVEALITRFMDAWGPGAEWAPDRTPHPHEAPVLRLDVSKAASRLGWSCQLDFDETIAWTADWYRMVADGADAQEMMLRQIQAYVGQRLRLTSPFPKDAMEPADARRLRA
jgi:CDP-glucose 4,6-dehydratase